MLLRQDTTYRFAGTPPLGVPNDVIYGMRDVAATFEMVAPNGGRRMACKFAGMSGIQVVFLVTPGKLTPGIVYPGGARGTKWVEPTDSKVETFLGGLATQRKVAVAVWTVGEASLFERVAGNAQDFLGDTADAAAAGQRVLDDIPTAAKYALTETGREVGGALPAVAEVLGKTLGGFLSGKLIFVLQIGRAHV